MDLMIKPGATPLPKQVFIDKCWDLVDTYLQGVEDGSIIAGAYIKKQVQQFKENVKDDRFEYQVDKVDQVFGFFSYVNVKYHDKYEQWPMLGWQAFFLALVFGFYYKDTDRRKVNEILLLIARKNAKTTFASGIILYGLLKDGVADPNTLLLAIGTAQGRIALRAAKSMIFHSPALLKRLRPQRNKIMPVDDANQGFCEVFSTADPDRLEGYNPSMTIIDEVHGFDPEKIPDVYNAIIQGTGERSNPLTILASTAGRNENEWFINKIDYYKAVLDKRIKDDSVAALIYQPDEGDDLTLRDTWRKANPSVDLVFPMYKLMQEFIKAKNSVAAIDMWYFLTKRVNIFYDEPDTWINSDDLHKVFKPLDIKDFMGKPCMLAIDLSQTQDLTALSVVFEDEIKEKHLYVFTYFFMADDPAKIIRKNGFDMTPYIGKEVMMSETNRVDGHQIMDKVRELNDNFEITKFMYDPLGAPYFIADVQKDMGIYVEPYRQTAMHFNVPINFIEDKVAIEDITFQENDVLEWNFGNVVITAKDSNQNKKIDKNKKKDAVDGAVATAMAIGGHLNYYYPILS